MTRPLGAENFRQALLGFLAAASEARRKFVDVNAGELHRALGGYPDPVRHRMPLCCSVMRAEMNPKAGDVVLRKAPSGAGPSLTIRYRLPRP